MGFQARNPRAQIGIMVGGYTMGVNQNQNCKRIPTICPTSRKKTFKTPNVIPNPAENRISISNRGTIASISMPGKFPVKMRNIKNKKDMIKKFIIAVQIMATGRQILGKFIFFKILALSKNTVVLRPIISANSPHVNVPAHKNMLYPKVLSIPGNFAFIT